MGRLRSTEIGALPLTDEEPREMPGPETSESDDSVVGTAHRDREEGRSEDQHDAAVSRECRFDPPGRPL